MSRWRTTSVALVAGALLAAGCGGADTPSRSQRDTPAAALRSAGWKVREVAGMPHTVSGAPQVGYLETTSPAGGAIDLQLFATAAQARGEAAAAERRLRGFHAAIVGELIAFSRGDGKRPVASADIAALRAALG